LVIEPAVEPYRNKCLEVILPGVLSDVRRLSITWLLLAIVMLIGCSRSLESQVSGKVTLDGKQTGPGVVVFVSEGGQSNPATGAVDLSGDYFLKTSRAKGLAPGKYRVSVSIFDQPTDVKPGERSMKQAKLIIPEKYVSATSSGLEFQVKPGNNTIDIELKSD
jgi:hypothetical protein